MRRLLRLALACSSLPALATAGCQSALGASAPPPSGDAGDASIVSSVDAAAGDAPEAAPSDSQQATFASFLVAAGGDLSPGHTPGASIAVVLGGDRILAGGIGVRDDAGAPVTTSTLFRAASLSKVVLAATAMSLVQDGLARLDAPITTYAPWFALAPGFDVAGVTLGGLLSHTSGFPCDTISQCGAGTSGSRRDFFAGNPQPLWAPPGAVWNYSNAGYALAASVLEGAAGVSEGGYEQLAHDRILAPVGMTTATFDASAAQAAEHATGHDVDAQGAVTATHEPTDLACPIVRPPGGLFVTATDLAHLARMLLAGGGSVLSPSSVAAMEAPHASVHTFATQAYGYALYTQLSPYPDHVSVWHTGELAGFNGEMFLVPDLGFAVVVLVNALGPTPVQGTIVGRALKTFIAETRTSPPLTTQPSEWSVYTGTFDDAYGTLGTGIAITQQDGGSQSLIMSAPGARTLADASAPISGAMKQLEIDEWQPPSGPSAITFFPGADGGAAAYAVSRLGVGARR
jgi:CubicO group peptidase (beta-lactamase class C family)